MLWVGNDNGWSKPIVVNQTEVWWVGSEEAHSGGTVSIFGRNLAHNNLDSTDAGGSSALNTRIYLEPSGGGSGTWVTPSAANPYKVDFVVPSLSAGDYNVWAHNGHGGEYGWSKVSTIEVLGSPISAFEDATLVTNKISLTNHDSTLDSSLTAMSTTASAADNATRLQAIINHYSAAYNGTPATRTILYLPAGTYEIGQMINIRSGVSILGELDGDDKLSTLKATRTWTTDNNASVFNIATENFNPSTNEDTIESIGFKDLVIDASDITLTGNLSHVINGHVGFSTAVTTYTTDFTIDNVDIDAGLNKALYIDDSERIFVKDTLLISSGIRFDTSRQVFMDGVDYRFTNNANSPIWIKSSDEISITNSTGRDFDSWDETANGGLGDWDWGSTTGWGVGRFIVVSSQDATPENIYIGENDTYDLTVNYLINPNTNEGEAILIEGAGRETSRAVGQVTGAVGQQISFDVVDANAAALGDVGLVVIDGKGTGQHRDFKPGEYTATDMGSYTTYTFTPSVEWEVIPDSTTRVALLRVATNVVTYRNELDFKDYARTATKISGGGFHKGISAIGLAFDDGSINVVADGNKTQESSTGMIISAGTSGVVQGAEDEFSMPAYWFVAANNEFGVDIGREDSPVDPTTTGGISVQRGIPDGGLPILGHIIRENTVVATGVTRLVDDSPLMITIDHEGTGLSVVPFDAFAFKDPLTSSWANDYFSATTHHGPDYVVFEQNDITATKGYVNQVWGVNTGAAVGGSYYLANSYPEHLVFLGNTFDSGVANQAPELNFNLRMDEDAIEAIVAAQTSNSTFYGQWRGANTVTPELSGDYQFHVLKDNVFKAAGVTEDPDFFYGEVGSDPILSPYSTRSITLEANTVITLTLPVLNPGSGPLVIDTVDDDASEAWITFIGNLMALQTSQQGAVTNLEFEISTVGLSAGSYSATIIVDLDDAGLPDIEWTILLTVI
jgi:hypothetical protein